MDLPEGMTAGEAYDLGVEMFGSGDMVRGAMLADGYRCPDGAPKLDHDEIDSEE